MKTVNATKKIPIIFADIPACSAIAIKIMNNIAALAEREQHHPDLHLENYRHLWVELYTHAIGGLSENDFIVAAKIDQIAPPQ